MSYLKIEQFRVFYLNRQNILMADEVMQEAPSTMPPSIPVK